MNVSLTPDQITSPPEKLSDLIDLAIEDARSLNRTVYQPNYTVWHMAEPEYCNVCLAGAMLAGTLGEPSDMTTAPEHYSDDWNNALVALDSVRNGLYFEALIDLGVEDDGYADAAQVPNDVEDARLAFNSALPQPVEEDFHSWEQFDQHLASLEAVADALRQRGY